MGVLYTVVPLNDEIADYLRDSGTAVPNFRGRTRNPTPAEIRRVCDAIPNIRTRFNTNPGGYWQAMMEDATDPEHEPGTYLNINPFSGREDEPHAIWFEKGWPSLILEVLRRLARDCGPLVLIPDTGETPIAVTAADSLDALFSFWEHTRGSTG